MYEQNETHTIIANDEYQTLIDALKYIAQFNDVAIAGNPAAIRKRAEGALRKVGKLKAEPLGIVSEYFDRGEVPSCPDTEVCGICDHCGECTYHGQACVVRWEGGWQILRCKDCGGGGYIYGDEPIKNQPEVGCVTCKGTGEVKV